MDLSYLNWLREFLRVKLEHRTPTGAWAGPAGFPKDRAWAWATESDEAAEKWADQPGSDCWFVDPATGEAPLKGLSELEAGMRWDEAGVIIAILFSLPWLWYFLLIRIRELIGAFRSRSGQ